MKSYIIITRNMNLIKCSVPSDALLHGEVNDRRNKKITSDVLISTPDQDFALLAFMEGAKVYEAYTNETLIPKYETEEELVEKLAEILLKVLGFSGDEKGYPYLKYMIKRHTEDLDYNSENMGTVVYPECAKVFGVSPRTVSKHANLALKNSFNKNRLKHIAVWGNMAGKDVIEAPRVAWFLVFAGEKIRTVMRNNLI